jgi:hypothetical protein
VLGVVGRQAELGEDVADVFSTALAEITSRRAMAVLEWPSAISARSCRSRDGQRPQGIVAMLPGQQLGNDLGVEHRRAAGDPVQGVQELADPGDPVFEQVADRAAQSGGGPGAASPGVSSTARRNGRS